MQTFDIINYLYGTWNRLSHSHKERDEMINPKYNPYLAKIFNSPSISKLASDGKDGFIPFIIKKSGFIDLVKRPITWGQLFDKIYLYLIENYRCEYIYKNAIANKILLGRHSLNTSTILDEFRVGKSKADVVIINGTSSVYEIKSEYDTFNRLWGQIESYKKVFDYINVVTHKTQAESLFDKLGSDIGLFVLTDKYTLKTIREPKSNKLNVEPDFMFDSLRKDEYCRIIKSKFGIVPDVPNTTIHKVSKKLFSTLPPVQAHDIMFETLLKRRSKKPFAMFVKSIPKSLKLAVLSTKLNKPQRISFSNLITSKFI